MPARSNITLSTESSELSLGGAPLTLRVNRRARKMTLRLDRRGDRLTLTIPASVSRRRALAWAAGHAEWARGAVAARPEVARLAPGAELMLFGRPHLIDWAEARPRRIALDGDRIVCGGPAEGLEARLLRWLRREALTVMSRETAEYAAKLGRPAGRVSIGDPRSRWGSCSARDDIRYSWRLILAPDFVRRATVAHEVAHMVHMHHGPEFHALVAELFGADPAPARAWLRRESAALHRVGAT